MLKNSAKAHNLLQVLKARGVRELCLCAGARNAPLIAAAHDSTETLQLWYFNDERSAAFFALGRILATGQPVAVSTTSGTAAAELLPALVEGHYAGLPLVAITADRPPEYRFTGAPQVIEQVNLYQHYVESSVDCVHGEELADVHWSGHQPIHFNICFAEPLLDATKSAVALQKGLLSPLAGVEERAGAPSDQHSPLQAPGRRPVVIVSTLSAHEAEVVGQCLSTCPWPIYCEGPSRLRELGVARQNYLDAPGEVMGALVQKGYIDSVIRIGGVPTTRFWRDLEDKYIMLPVLSVSRLPFPGLTRGEVVVCKSPAQWQQLKLLWSEADARDEDHLFVEKKFWQESLESALAAHPLSEPALLRALVRRIPPESNIYVGNSLPIREWDLVAPYDRPRPIFANRGANGIDGQLSTFLGVADTARENWCILGDLTTLYDLGAPWIVRDLPRGTRLRIVVVNNGGGRIFQRLFGDAKYQNCHDFNFVDWAKMWGFAYRCWPNQSRPSQGGRLSQIGMSQSQLSQKDGLDEFRTQLREDLPERCVIELRPDFAESEGFWRSYGRS